MGSESDLDLMLASAITKDERQEQAKEDINKLKVTKGTHAKIQLYADLTSRITDCGMECYGYLLKPKWSTDNLITDAYFADEQIVTSAHVEVPVEGIRMAKEKIDSMDMEIVGWWHSHDTMAVFHSGTDEENFRRVLNGISPDSQFRRERAPYVVDDKNKRVVFEDYALTDLSAEEIEIFKNRDIPALKKVLEEPFAYSMVVNHNRDRYIERISKTLDPRTKEFRLNNPTHPRLEEVKVDDDLEFLVADIEWEVRQKIIERGFGTARTFEDVVIPNQEKEEEFDATIDSFIKNLTRYARHGGEKGKFAYNILFNPDSNIYSEIAQVRKIPAEGEERKNSTIKAVKEDGTVKDRLKTYFTELPEANYRNWRKKIHMFDRQHILARRFMYDFCKAGDAVENGERKELQTKVFDKYHNIALRLNNAQEIADKGMKSMTKYAMETTTDYANAQGHKYRNLIGAILTKMSGEQITSFERATRGVLSSPRRCDRKPLFIWEDRFNICDQLTIDAYQLKIGSIYKMPELTEDRTQTLRFLEDFAKFYATDPSKLDGLIEEQLLGQYHVAEEKFSKFSDSSYGTIPSGHSQRYALSMYKPTKGVRVKYTKPQNAGVGADDVSSSKYVPGQITQPQQHLSKKQRRRLRKQQQQKPFFERAMGIIFGETD